MFEKGLSDGYSLEILRTGKESFQVLIKVDGQLSTAPLDYRGFFWRKPKRFKTFINDISEHLNPTNRLRVSTLQTLDIDKAFTEMEAALAQDKSNSESSVGDVASVGTLLGVMRENEITHICHSVHGQNIYTYYTTYTSPELVDNQIQWKPYLITSDKEIFPLEPAVLAAKKLFFEVLPSFPIQRWSIESIQKFLQGECRAGDYFDLHTEITGIYERFMDYYEGPVVSKVLALWVIGTYYHQIFSAFPYVYLNGTKASGKTKTLIISEQLALNPVNSVNMSTPSLFRLIEAMNATVLIDESEELRDKEKREGYRELLNAGYKRSAITFRTEERKEDDVKKFHVKKFRLYSPKMIANIAGIEDVLESRCISIVMKPTINVSKGNTEPDVESGHWQATRNRLYEMYMTSAPMVKAVYEALENEGGFKNREWELWKPILALAMYFDKDQLYPEILEFARKKAEEARMEDLSENAEFILIKLLQDNIDRDGYWEIKQVVDWFALELGYDDQLHRPKWLNSRYISNVLKTLGFRDKRRLAKGVEVHIKRAAITDQVSRMGIELKESAKIEWLKQQIKPIVPVSLISLEVEFRQKFGDIDENIDIFWSAIRQFREQKLVMDFPNDMIMLSALPAQEAV